MRPRAVRSFVASDLIEEFSICWFPDEGEEESGYLDVDGGSDDDMAHEAGYIETKGFEEDDEGSSVRLI
jgi:hypothetical protein